MFTHTIARHGRQIASGLVIVFALALAGLAGYSQQASTGGTTPLDADITQGALRVKTEGGVVECPLRHTDVRADISGFIARVTVTQTFYNPFADKIEAVYVFPLPHTAAVDDMTMVIGDRKIVGVIKRRADARALYEQALAQGLTASLLEQERPNIFTQSVGNIKPKNEVKIVISYVDVLAYDMGTYEFHFPMVVGPRYNAGAPFAGTPAGAANRATTPTGAMPAEGVNPPVLQPGFRTGHDISLSVTLDAGVPVHDMKVMNHQAAITRTGDTKATVVLSPADAVPNKDFVLRYTVIGEKPELALLSNCPNSSEGYFMLMLQPRIDEQLAKAPPRELVFLIDVSGSMMGAPTQKNIAIMREFFQRTKASDTFQVITFAGSAGKLFDKSVPVTPENTQKALSFTNGMQGGGGTEMMKAINMVLDEPADPERVRIVVMLTDGFIGNEAEIIEAVGKKAGDRIRFWTVGIGSSPNRFLLDGVAKQGGGMSATVDLKTDPKETVGNIVERIHRAQLANIKIDWNGLPIYEVYPRRIPELWAGRPVILFGRFSYGSHARVTISGVAEGKPLSYDLDVYLPDGRAPEHEVLAKVWARNKIEDLMAQMYYGESPEVIEEVTQLALDYRLMSQYTSFVAVDEADARALREPAAPPRRIAVPVPLPEGVSFDGIFGNAVTADEDKDAAVTIRTGATGASSSTLTATAFRDVPAAHWASPAPADGRLRLAEKSLSGGGRAYGGGVAKTPGAPPPASYAAPSTTAAAPAGPAGAPGIPVIAAGTTLMALDADEADATWSRTDAARPSLLMKSAAKRHEEAQKALTLAGDLRKLGDLDGAFRKARQAYLLESAFVAAGGYGSSETLAAASALLGSLAGEISAKQHAELPALKKTLDLVIRDMSVAEAAEAIARAAGFEIILPREALDDAATLLGGKAPRVSYLDLRGATAAQALDWLLTPCSLDWRASDGRIQASTAPRLPGDNSWVYPIGDLVAPTEKELGHKPTLEDLDAGLAVFLHVVHLAIGQQGDSGLDAAAAVLLDGGSLLVCGDAATHAKVRALLDYLTIPRVRWSQRYNGLPLTATQGAEVDALRPLTQARRITYAALRGKVEEARAQTVLLTALQAFSWQLFAGAAGSKLDDEALTELQIVWRDPGMASVLAGPSAGFALRSAWLMNLSANLLPRQKALAALAEKAAALAAGRFENIAQALREKPEPGSYLNALYAALLVREVDLQPRAREHPALPAETTAELVKLDANSQVAAYRALAASLLAPSAASDDAARALITGDAGINDDVLVLLALAARARGSLKPLFRTELPEIVKRGGVSGSVLVGVNRLTAARPAK